jgi:hypothetical protein
MRNIFSGRPRHIDVGFRRHSGAPRTDSNSKCLRQSLREKTHPSSRTVADRSQHDNPLRHTPSLTLTLRPSLDRMIGGGFPQGDQKGTRCVHSSTMPRLPPQL